LLGKSDPCRRYLLVPGFDAADLVKSEVRSAGFAIVSRDDHFIDNPDEGSTRWMIVFRQPPS
jgi:hypothetical protein